MATEQLDVKRQIGIVTEAVTGTVETINTTDVIRVVDPEFSLEGAQFERNLARENFSMPLSVMAGDDTNFATILNLTFGVELAGHKSGAGSIPDWGRALVACGMEQVEDMTYMTIGAVTGGPFQHGEEILQTTSAATGNCLGDTVNGDTTVFVEVTAGTFNGTALLTGQTSGATATASTVSNTGCAWRPFTDVAGQYHATPSVANGWLANASATAAIYMEGQRVIGRGMRGTFSMPCTWGDKVVMPITLRGILSSYADGANLSVNYNDRTPPVFRGANLALDVKGESDTDVNAQLSGISVDFGSSVVVRQNANDSSGYDPAIINGRSCTGTMDPDMVTEADFPWFANWVDGRSLGVRWEVGSVAGNRFRAKVAAAQSTGPSLTSREEVTAWTYPFNCTAGDHYGGGDNQIGADNEFVLIYY